MEKLKFEPLPIEQAPKRKNRFVLEFPDELNIESWQVQKINLPKLKNNKWEDIRIEFIDFIGPSVSESLIKLKNIKKGFFSKNPIFTIKIKILDPVGFEIDSWIISIKSVKEIHFGNLDYSKDEFIKPILVLEPKNCVKINLWWPKN